MVTRGAKRVNTTRHIRNAIDHCPDGICFSATDGRPILANQKINYLCLQIMGHTIFNMEEFWRILKQKGDSRLDSESNEGTELIVCKLADECVWQFQKQPLFIRRQIIFQTIASDVTALHVYQDHLQKNIRKEEELHERQRELLQHIVQNNLDQELLNAKLRIHDDFGSVLLMTMHWLKNTEHVPDN